MNDAANIRQLTSLRFFAALWVVLFHYWPKLDSDAAIPQFVHKGYLGVELFFVLSGFILCHVYRTSLEDGRFRYGSFLWNRLARVYPLHLATLLGMIVLALGAQAAGFGIDANILSWESLPANLLLLQAWGLAPQAAFNHPSWSISAEWFAYLTFPVFAWAALALKDKPLTALGLAIGFLVGLYAAFEHFTGFPLTQATIQWGALRIVPCFAYGCALHALWRARPSQNRSTAALGAVGSALAVLVLAALAAPDAAIVTMLGALIFFLARMAQTGSETFGNTPLVYLGEISYSVYMVCVPWKIVFVNAAAKLFELSDERLPLWLWLVFLGGVIPLAAASYHLIEKPSRTAMKRWADSWEARRPSTAGA